MAQSWNDVLSYIKINFGSVNKLEISDDDLVKNLREQVLPIFSQYRGRKKFKELSSANLIQSLTGQPLYQYRIPLDENEYIVDILAFNFSKNTSLIDVTTPLINSPEGAIDTLIYNSYIDIVKSMQAKNTWEFFPPDIIAFDFDIGYGILEYTCQHDDLRTLDPDSYQTIFKKLCLANVKLWVAANRSKFDNLTTPFGTMNLNWEALKAEGAQEREEAMQLLNMLPPQFLLNIDV